MNEALAREKSNVDDAIIAVEEMQADFKNQVEELKGIIKDLEFKNGELAASLEVERNLRLQQVYQSESNQTDILTLQNEYKNLMESAMKAQEICSEKELENIRLREIQSHYEDKRNKFECQLSLYEQKIFESECHNVELRRKLLLCGFDDAKTTLTGSGGT